MQRRKQTDCFKKEMKYLAAYEGTLKKQLGKAGGESVSTK